MHFQQARYISNIVIGVWIRNILQTSEAKASIILTTTLMGNCTFLGDMTHIEIFYILKIFWCVWKKNTPNTPFNAEVWRLLDIDLTCNDLLSFQCWTPATHCGPVRQTQDVEPMQAKCRAIVYNAGTALNRHWFRVLYLLCDVFTNPKQIKPASKHKTFV